MRGKARAQSVVEFRRGEKEKVVLHMTFCLFGKIDIAKSPEVPGIRPAYRFPRSLARFGNQGVDSARLRLPSSLVRVLALVFLLSGFTIRWISIVTLGRLFTVDVAIRQDHTLVQHGLYRLVRHPSYTGLLLALFGLGLFYANWLSPLSLMAPSTLAVVNRIAKEERVLLVALGPPYVAYCARTRRLFPGLV